MISGEAVVWGYRILLGRDPESEGVVRSKMGLFDLGALRRELMNSEEYGGIGEVMTELGCGGKLWVRGDLVGMGILRGEYEVEEQRWWTGRLRRGRCVLDVGAHYGLYSVLAGVAGCEVVAVEPVSHLNKMLRKSVAANEFGGRVGVVDEAVGGERGRGRMVYAPVTSNEGGAYLMDSGFEAPRDHVADDVGVVLLGDVAPRPLDLVKMDVEGSEWKVLTGGEAVLREDRPAVLCELHEGMLRKVSGVGGQEVIDFMSGMGYICKAFVPGGLMQVTKAPGPLVNVVFEVR